MTFWQNIKTHGLVGLMTKPFEREMLMTHFNDSLLQYKTDHNREKSIQYFDQKCDKFTFQDEKCKIREQLVKQLDELEIEKEVEKDSDVDPDFEEEIEKEVNSDVEDIVHIETAPVQTYTAPVKVDKANKDLIYVLKLKSGKFYVGRTSDVNRRYSEHLGGKGSHYTKIYHPLELVETTSVMSPHDENNKVKDYMARYGIENVRGGSYSQITLPKAVKSTLENELIHNRDDCLKCGKPGHYIKNCPKKDISKTVNETFLLHEKGMSIKEIATTRKLSPSTIENHLETCFSQGLIASFNHTPRCFKCSTYGHYSTTCWK